MRKVRIQPETAKKVVGYIRVSSHKQVSEGASLERQEAGIKAYCVAKGFPEPQIISDEAVSGSKKNRPGFKQIVAMCRAGELGQLVIYDFSRLHRDVANATEFRDIADRAGVEVHDVQKGLIKTETATDKVQFNIEAAVHQHYRDIISDKVKASIRQKRAKGEHHGGVVPFGFELVDGVRLIPKPDEYDALKLMHSLRQQGATLRAIAATLQVQGVPTKTGRGSWDAKVIMRILDRTADLICQDESLTCEQVDALLHDVTGALYQAEKAVCGIGHSTPQERRG